jgi:signal transduction histidine kinase
MASVSHDLKNPLNALLMSTESLRRRPTDEGLAKHLQVVRRSVERMTRLVGDILDASAIERGRLALDPRPENAQAVVQEALDLMRPLASAKTQTLEASPMPSAERIEVFCDRGRILQVLANLVGNAIKFSPERGTIVVEVGSFSRTSAAISVRDTGPGISARDLPHVFERYWHTRTSDGGGSGLGLFISKAIVEAHGGQMWAESPPGAGATFRFTLPAKAVPS